MRLTVVIPAAHNPQMTNKCLELATKNARGDTQVGVFNNGVGFGLFGTGKNVGNFDVFRQIRDIESEFVLVIHNDLYIWEPGYDERIIEAFDKDPLLGLIGFVGSDEFDIAGGRGAYAWTNFQGRDGGSPAEHHGVREAGFKPAANLDGVALCFRNEHLRSLDIPEDFPPHHFYDRLFPLMMLEAGFHVGYLGVACDHLNGQTANVYEGYHDLARKWCEDHNCVRTDSPDHDVYLEAEYRVITEYRDEKMFFPLRVGPDYTIYHTHPRRI